MPFRAAIIGCGLIGSGFSADPMSSRFGVCTHAAAYHACPETDLVAICDSNVEKLSCCARDWSVDNCYVDVAHMLHEVQPEIVSVCTPDHSHAAIVGEALDSQGVRAVIAEKPLALDLIEAATLVDRADNGGVLLAVNYSRRFGHAYRSLARDIRDGKYGEAKLISGLYTKGVYHNGTHWFDLVRMLVGECVLVDALNRLQDVGSDPGLDVAMYLAGGGRAQLNAVDGGDFTIFEMDILTSRARIRIVDSGDTIETYESVNNRPFAGYRTLERVRATPDHLRNLTLAMITNVVDAIEGRASLYCSGNDGLRALQIAAAAHESSVKGEPVDLQPQYDLANASG